jgi:hypothetical protein
MKRILFAPAAMCIALLIAATGCGGGSSFGNGTTGTSGGGNTGNTGANGPNSILNGKYAFSVSGSANIPGAPPLFMAGSFAADGAGNITSGIEDLTEVSVVVSKGIAVSGTYSIGTDGRGTLNFTSPGQTFKFAIENGNHGQMIRFDSGGSGSGTFDLQTASAFNLNSLAGSYAFAWNGNDPNANGAPADGIGAFVLATGTANGAADLNDAGTVGQATVSATLQAPDANGHGIATITYGTTAVTYGYDIISANRFLLIETDGILATAGEADLQSATFTASSLSGNYAITLGGSNTNGGFALAGQIVTDGQNPGNITSSDVTQNSAGAVASGPLTLGTYTFANVVQAVTVNGRFQLTATEPSGFTDTFVLYMISPTQALIMETDAGQVTSGEILTQTAGPFSTASLNGNYGVNVSGVDSGGAEGDVAGQFTSGGTSTLTAGTVDVNDEGSSPTTTFANQAISGGSYTLVNNSTGHGTMTFMAAGATFQFTFYFVSPSEIFLVETDNQALLSVGSALSQPAIP